MKVILSINSKSEYVIFPLNDVYEKLGKVIEIPKELFDRYEVNRIETEEIMDEILEYKNV